MSTFEPTPEPSGALVPPGRVPPIALATATPPPPPVPGRSTRVRRRGGLVGLLQRFAGHAFDAADALVARVTGGRAPALLLVLGLPCVPAGAQAQTARDSVLATVQEFLRTMTAQDSAGAAAILMPEGHFYAVAVQRDSARIRYRPHAGYLATLGRGGQDFVERIWEPTVMIHGPIAVVWTRYDFYVGGRFSHCGVDAFTLLRTPAGWKIADGVYTTETADCPPSPLGPLQRP